MHLPSAIRHLPSVIRHLPSVIRHPASAICLLVACASPDASPQEPASIRVLDDAGREVTLASPARRIISLVPARTETLLALGAGDRLIARTRYDLDSRLASLPSVGNALNPSVEWLASQRPDLIIAWADGESRTVIERVASLGVAAYATRVETIDEFRGSVRDLASLIGEPAAADSLLAAIDAELATVRASVGGRSPLRALYLVGTDPPLAAGPGTFVTELLEIVGVHNVVGDSAHRWPQLSTEEVLRRDPDVIIVSTSRPTGDPVARFRTSPGWRTVTAVRAGRVIEVDADLFNRAGPRLGYAATMLASLLEPWR